uniref:Uncharacterized protein n=1 Tax=Steinernema glaseri TaxID=37863 RepID=A0A1I7Y542_9BILA
MVPDPTRTRNTIGSGTRKKPETKNQKNPIFVLYPKQDGLGTGPETRKFRVSDPNPVRNPDPTRKTPTRPTSDFNIFWAQDQEAPIDVNFHSVN